VRLRKLGQPETLIMIIALAARLLPGPRTIDDAYITFRYAQNLLAGNGLVYNPGEAVLGTTTPIYALLMAGLGLFTGGSQAPFPTLALLVNALADGLTCWLLNSTLVCDLRHWWDGDQPAHTARNDYILLLFD